MSESSTRTLSRTFRKNPPSLEIPALLTRLLGGWSLKLFRTAGEAILTLDRGRFGEPSEVPGEGPAKPPELVEAESAQRARAKIRRWIRHNRATYLWTFTFREAQLDYTAVGLAVDQFLTRVREAGHKKDAAPRRSRWLFVPEPHPGGHGWHLHAVTTEYVSHALVARLWGHGFVFVSGPTRGKSRWPVRTLARYLSKYVSKVLGADELHGCSPRPKGAHRYWVTQGCDPVGQRTYHATAESAVAYLRREYGAFDEMWVFGVDDDWPITGIFFSFPDRCLERPAERVKGVSPP